MVASGPVKILFIIDNFSSPFAGTEGQLFKLLKGLDRSKYSPHLLLFRRSNYIEEHGCPCNYSVLGKSKILSPTTWFNLFQRLKSFKRQGFKIAHIFFNDPSIIAPPLLKILGVKCIISRRDMGYWYTPSYLALLRFNSRFVDHVAVNSEAVKMITCDEERYASSRVSVIYNGYQDTTKLNKESISFKKNDSEVVLGIVANIRPIKRLEDAVEALAVINSATNTSRLVICGGGDVSQLEELANRLGVRDRLHCVGAQIETSAFTEGFDICLLCSESEGFSNAVIEYMQHGKPVVCSEVGGNSEIISHGETGYLYPAGDIEALVGLLRYLIENPQRRFELGRQARKNVIENYGMTKMLDAHEALYEALLGRDMDP